MHNLSADNLHFSTLSVLFTQTEVLDDGDEQRRICKADRFTEED